MSRDEKFENLIYFASMKWTVIPIPMEFGLVKRNTN